MNNNYGTIHVNSLFFEYLKQIDFPIIGGSVRITDILRNHMSMDYDMLFPYGQEYRIITMSTHDLMRSEKEVLEIVHTRILEAVGQNKDALNSPLVKAIYGESND